MPTISEKIRSAWFKCVESVGQSAANMADSAKQKLNEINMEAQRKEMLSDLPNKLMQMWKDGAELPEELNDTMAQLNKLDEELAAFRAARLAKKAKPAITDGSDAVAAEETATEETVATAEENLTEAVEAAEEMIGEAVETAEEVIDEAVEYEVSNENND